MKKITLMLMLFLACISTGYSQVAIGEGTNEDQMLPFEPYYGYSYSQSIYLASEINANGLITSLQWYYSGNSMLNNSQQIVIYFGITDKVGFNNNADFVDLEDLVQVYAGGIPVNGAPGWVTINLTTPFAYDGISNLVIAVDENKINFDNFDDDFYNSPVVGNRSIYAFADDVNFDPANPSIADPNFAQYGRAAFVPNIILGGIQQACPKPTAITFSNVTISGATINWTAQAGQSNWEVKVQEADMDAPAASQSGELVTGTPSFAASNLLSNTLYAIYVRAICSDAVKSSWSGPVKFYTMCEFFDDFSQNFNDTAYGQLPNCWNRKVISNVSTAYVKVMDYGGVGNSNSLVFYNSSDENAQLYLISPGLTAIGANSHRIKFKSKTYGNSSIVIGTMTDPADVTTFTALNTINLGENYTNYSYTFDTSTTDSYIAFKHGGGAPFATVFIEDIVWEPIPSAAPECASDLSVEVDLGCGNFENVFEWSAVPGADGYYISIGTAEMGGDLIVDNLNIYSALSYSFTGNIGTTYYYKLTPYNAFGPAVGCLEDNFVTYEDGCYCESEPTIVDGGGISLISINDSEFANGPITYFDFSFDGAVDITRGVTTSIFLTFETGYAYDTNIWIDANDNFTFEPSELVFSGESSSANPTVFNASFLTGLNLNLGEHRMRIGAADYGQTPPNPCFNDQYGLTLDFLINVLEAPACLPPSSTNVSNITATSAQVNWISQATTYNLEYGEAPFTLGTGTLISGIAANQVVLSDLGDQVTYSYFLQSNCATDGLSPWNGPYTFKTACGGFGSFSENFDTQETIEFPDCWTNLINSTSDNSYTRIYPFSGNLEMFNAEDGNAAIYAITPILNDLSAGTHRVKFKAYSYTEGLSVIVGTIADPGNGSTFTPVQTIAVSDLEEEYFVSFTTPSTDPYLAFKFVGTGVYQSIYLDDFIWEPLPQTLPECISNLVVQASVVCGNYPTIFTWSPVADADYYSLTLGTSSGAGATQNIGNVTTFNVVGNFGTTYFYTLVPVNSLGAALGCVEGSFTTFEEGCYCESFPDSDLIGGNGITSLSIGSTTFPIPLATYIDLTAETVPTLVKGAFSNNSIIFETGYGYNTNIWVDWNDNYIFETSELLYSGESGFSVPYILDGSFTVPISAPLGAHRMRIGTADYGQEIPDPCFDGEYGITIDLNVNVVDDLGTVDFDNNSFTAYPNPVKNVLNVSSIQNISDLAVYNLLGQQVLLMNVNASKVQIDMTNLTSGTYLVKVNSENGVKIIKVIKE